MLAFGCSITMPAVYEGCAGRGIARAAEPDSVVLAHAAAGSLARSYNLMFDEAAARDDLEALVLVHQDAEIDEPGFADKVRAALADPDVGAAGCAGADGVADIAWWDGSVAWGASVQRFGELGGGEARWPGRTRAPGPVDTLYGVLLALPAWTVRTLRFDESLALAHGYDLDLCRQLRAAGKAVVVEPWRIVHRRALELVTDPESWEEAHMAVAERWDAGEHDWRARARRAEAEAGAARMVRASRALQAAARAREQERELARVTGSASWRLTEPLRRVNARRAARRRGDVA